MYLAMILSPRGFPAKASDVGTKAAVSRYQVASLEEWMHGV